MGHVIPLVEFAKRLVGNHGFTATFVVPTYGPPSNAMNSVLEGLPEAVDHVFLPPVSFDDPPKGSKIEMRIFLTVSSSLPALRDALASIISWRRVSLVALVFDFLSIDASDVAREFNLSSYVFYPSMATTLSLLLHLPNHVETTSCEYRELPDPVNFAGGVPIPSNKDLPDSLQDRKNDAYRWTIHMAKRHRLAYGIC